MPDANLIIGVTYDDKGRAALIASNERAFKQSSSRMAAHEQQVRRGSAFSGGQNAAYRTGMISQQAQDVAVSLQMGMSASRVIAQQGSQIASIFGPYGMVLGGIVAITAAIWEFSTGTEAAAKRAKELEDHLKTIRDIGNTTKDLAASADARVARRETGDLAADTIKQNRDYQKQMDAIREKMAAVNKDKADKINKEGLGGLDYSSVEKNSKRQARLKVITDEAAEKTAKYEKEAAELRRDTAEAAADTAIKSATDHSGVMYDLKSGALLSEQRASERTEKDKEMTEDLAREIEFVKERNKIRASGATWLQKEAQLTQNARNYELSNAEVAATRQRKREEENADRYLKDAEKQVKLTEEKTKNEKEASQFRDTSVQKYKRAQDEVKKIESEIAKGGAYNTPEKQAELAEKKLELLKQEEGAVKEIEAMQREGAEFAKAGLAGTEAQNKRKVIEMEMDLLNKKKAFSPIEAQQIANKLELLRREQVNENFNMGAMGAGGMGAFNRNRKAQERAQDMAERRALENMGLIGIQKGVGGEIIAGTDPITGRKLTKDELAKRKADMAAEKMRRDMERKAAAGDKEAQERLKRVRWGNEGGNDGKIAAGFTPEQITELSKSIADAILATTTK